MEEKTEYRLHVYFQLPAVILPGLVHRLLTRHARLNLILLLYYLKYEVYLQSPPSYNQKPGDTGASLLFPNIYVHSVTKSEYL